jgi:hypothetical protein
MGEVCSTDGHMINVFKILVGKPEGKRPLRRPRHRWENSINLYHMGMYFPLLRKNSIEFII